MVFCTIFVATVQMIIYNWIFTNIFIYNYTKFYYLLFFILSMQKRHHYTRPHIHTLIEKANPLKSVFYLEMIC